MYDASNQKEVVLVEQNEPAGVRNINRRIFDTLTRMRGKLITIQELVIECFN